jgi:outer membrane assembly lipoprotein YfiO
VTVDAYGSIGRRRVRVCLAGCLVGVTLAAVGCGSTNPFPPGSYERGLHYQEAGQRSEAVKAYEAYLRSEPTDSLAAEAQYRTAVCYQDLEQYPLAAVEYQILRKDHPMSARVEDAYFAEGVCYLRQVDRVERDMTSVDEARRHFREFARKYPESEHMPEVEEYLQEMSDMVVRKRLGAAHVYRQLGRDRAAGITLDDIIATEPNSTLIDQAMIWRAEVSTKTGDWEVGMDMCQAIIADHPDSKYVKRAEKILAELQAKLPNYVPAEP